MLSPIIALLFNAKLNRWHPIIFAESPLPGPESPDKPIRHKSKGHHTDGFETREKAVEHINTELKSNLENQAIGIVRVEIQNDIVWNGEGIPALTEFFG